jgi:hypothetical protein
MAKRKLVFFEDPSVAHVAGLIAEEARQEIERLIIHENKLWYHAREIVLASMVPGWLKAYGRPCADQAVRLVHSLDPDGDLISPAGRREQQRQTKEFIIEFLKRKGRYNLINRLFLAVLGMPLYA